MLCFCPPVSVDAGPYGLSLWTNRSPAVGPPIKADWGLGTVSPGVQQPHSVWDYHTCGSGINPSRDMGTRDKTAPNVQCRNKRRRNQLHPRMLPPWGLLVLFFLTFVDQKVGNVGGRSRTILALNHTNWFLLLFMLFSFPFSLFLSLPASVFPPETKQIFQFGKRTTAWFLI